MNLETLRLRPEGRSGALMLSLDGYRAYFSERAEPWERQALIKSRFCAGSGTPSSTPCSSTARCVFTHPGFPFWRAGNRTRTCKRS